VIQLEHGVADRTMAAMMKNDDQQPITFCPECGHVDSHLELKINHPCQTCGTNISARQLLFSSENRLLQMIFDSRKNEESKEVCILLFCALVENHLRSLLQRRCLRVKIEPLVIDLLLEGYERVGEREKLFKRLTGIAIKNALARTSYGSVFETYEKLKSKRNNLAHGNPGASSAITNQDVEAAVSAAATSFPAFAYLHQTFCAVDSPLLAKNLGHVDE
jgi:hypothetical protein